MGNTNITNREVKRRNRNRIYQYMRKRGIVSNPDIAHDLKLSLPTVAQNTKELVEKDLLLESGEMDSTGGRKAKGLVINSNSRMAIGLDITRNHVGVLLTNLTGEILVYERIHYPFSETEEFFQGLNDIVERFIKQHVEQKERLLGIGISIPGIVDLNNREIATSHILGLRGLSFEKFERCFPYPCIFLNDANAGAFAEGLQDGGRFFYLSLSNTVGGSFFDEGKIMYGKDFRCGEIGHMILVPDGLPCYCGKSGCMDSYCNAKKLSHMADGVLEKFFEELQQGNAEMKEAWEEYSKYLAIAVNNIHMVLDCDIILGGYVGSYIGEYIPEIRKKVADCNTFIEDGSFIRACNYKVAAAAFGAASYVIESFVEQI